MFSTGLFTTDRQPIPSTGLPAVLLRASSMDEVPRSEWCALQQRRFRHGDHYLGWPTNTLFAFYNFNSTGSSSGSTSLPAARALIPAPVRSITAGSVLQRTGSHRFWRWSPGGRLNCRASTNLRTTCVSLVEMVISIHGLRGINLCSSTANGIYPSKVVFPANQLRRNTR